MKGKKLIVLISILAFLTVLIILNSTLFTLQDVSINWMTTKYKLEIKQDEDILQGVDMGESIFLLNKSNIAAKLEKENPYFRVVGIETKFPNKIVVHGAERETLYAVGIGNNKYAVVDELGKVLELTGSSVFAGSALGAKPIAVTFNNLHIDSNSFQEGEQIKDKNIRDLLVLFAKTLRESNYIPTASKGVFEDMFVDMSGTGFDISMKTRVGILIKVVKAHQYTTEKFLTGLAAYNDLHQNSVVDGQIEVRYNAQEGFSSVYSSTIA